MKRIVLQTVLLLLCTVTASAQKLRFTQPHGFYDEEFTTEIVCDSIPTVPIYYTLDGSEPTTRSTRYHRPLTISHNAIVRAVAIADTGQVTKVTSATYLFLDDVMKQSNTPEGYPAEWGSYTDTWGTAVADYEMDPEMTEDPYLAPRIREGLMSLPVMSIITDKDNLFSHEPDPDTGGIYIFTGPPVGDNTGHGWTRFANVELFGGSRIDENGNEVPHDMHISCGLRLHGGHGRLAEKNPKHSFRLVFKKKYGKKTLKYPLFGEDEPHKFDQLVLRCHFGNTWQHWLESNRKKAQYTRDVWARRMQRRMGWTSVNALYVHVFLNGMYWGIYNIAERVDEKFGESHLGGEEGNIDVIKVEEDGGNHIEAAEGNMEAWYQMVETAAQAADNTYYNKLQGLDADGNPDPEQEALLDIDAFIDYMLINQYGGNTDWDHHNWYAIRRGGADSEGFRFLCWDSELILDNPNENVLGKNNGSEYPTGIFQSLMQNEQFVRRYLRRAKTVLADDGFLGETSAVEVFDSLYNTISSALYAEAARWGDYRRDVHPYTTQGYLYTVDDTYMTERNRLLNEYFPTRTETVLNSIVRLANIDDFEAPANWVALRPSMFQEWDGGDGDAQPTGRQVNVDWNIGQLTMGGSAVAGFVGVEYNRYADITPYEKLVLRGSGDGLRILANRLVDHGPWKQITVNFDESDPYWDADIQGIVLPLSDLSETFTSEGVTRDEDFLHLHVLKVDWNHSATVTAAYLVPVGADEPEDIDTPDDTDDPDETDEPDPDDSDDPDDTDDPDDSDDPDHPDDPDNTDDPDDPDNSDDPEIDTAIHQPKPVGTHRDNKFYTLNGQEVSRPTRGLYIYNGRKVLIK